LQEDTPEEKDVTSKRENPTISQSKNPSTVQTIFRQIPEFDLEEFRKLSDGEELTQEDEEAAEKLSTISILESDEENPITDEEESAAAYLESLAKVARRSIARGNSTSSAFFRPHKNSRMPPFNTPKVKTSSMLSIDSILNHSSPNGNPFQGFAPLFAPL